jgi:hypothetical protein
MNPEYKDLRIKADKIFYRCNDVLDDKGAAGSLTGEVRNVVEDFEQGKNPRSIEDRIKRIIEQLKDIRSQGQIMDTGDADDLIDRYEELREELRGMSNY